MCVYVLPHFGEIVHLYVTTMIAIYSARYVYALDFYKHNFLGKKVSSHATVSLTATSTSATAVKFCLILR